MLAQVLFQYIARLKMHWVLHCNEQKHQEGIDDMQMPMSERFRDSPVFKISFYRRSIINNNFDYDLRISRIEPRSKNFSNTTVGNFPKKFAKFRIHRIFRKDIFRPREKIGEFGISPEFLCFARNRFNPYFTGSVP